MTTSTDPSFLDKLKNAVSNVAPLLGTALGSPLAGVAVSLISSAFGGNSTNPDDLLTKIATDPAAAVKLKELELTHEEQLKTIALQTYEAQLGDIQNARGREEKIVEVTGKNDWMLNFIAILVIVGFFAMGFTIAYTKMDQTDHDVLYMMIGQLTAGFITVLSYYFGSSNKS